MLCLFSHYYSPLGMSLFELKKMRFLLCCLVFQYKHITEIFALRISFKRNLEYQIYILKGGFSKVSVYNR